MKWASLAAACCLALAPVGAVWADTPPDWAVGIFHGDHGGLRVDVEMTISRRGDVVRLYREQGGRIRKAEGQYRDGRLRVDGTTYDLDRKGNGIRVTNVRDSGDWIQLDRDSAPWGPEDRDRYGNHDGGPGWGGQGGWSGRERIPEWAIGVFQGDEGRHKVPVEVGIAPTGAIYRTYRELRGTRRATGTWRDSMVRLGSDTYRIVRTDRGIRLLNVDDRNDWVSLSRVGRGWSGDPGGWRGGGNDDRDRYHDDGGPAGLVEFRITRPGRNAQVSGPSVEISGTCNTSMVRVEVTRRGGVTSIQTVQARDGRWSAQLSLEAGTYTAVARAIDRGSDGLVASVNFEVTSDRGRYGRDR